MFRPLTSIREIIIHHSATPNGRVVSAEEIDEWHRQRNFRRSLPGPLSLPHIGYHRIILLDGTVVDGRTQEEVGAHAYGFNARSVGICLIGLNRFTEAQWAALAAEVAHLMSELPGPLTLAGHRDRGSKGTCPGFDVGEWVDRGYLPLQEAIL